MSENFRSYTVDFWSVMVQMSVAEALDLESELTRLIDMLECAKAASGKGTGFHITPWGSKTYSEPVYRVSLWGHHTCNLVATLRRLQVHPTRVDLRCEGDLGAPYFKLWRDEAALTYAGRKNINTYNHKRRQKDDTRDRGGLGIAFGSLKSRERLSIYQHSLTGPIAVEIQFRNESAVDVGNGMLEVIFDTERTGDMPQDYITPSILSETLWDQFAVDRIEAITGMDVDMLFQACERGTPELAASLMKTATDQLNYALSLQNSFINPAE